MIRTLFCMITVIVMTIIIGLSVILIGWMNPYSQAVNILGRIWSKTILWSAGVKIIVEGLENIQPNTSYVIMGNHQSHFDVPAIFSIVNNLTIRFFTKKELFSIPLFGWAMKSAGMIKIDRSNRSQAIKSMSVAVKKIKQKGTSLVVFPEGTRGTDGEVHEFKKGGFVIAIKGHIPVLPVSVSGSRFILKKHTLKIDPGYIKIVFDKPIETNEYGQENKDRLMSETQQVNIKNIDHDINNRRIHNGNP